MKTSELLKSKLLIPPIQQRLVARPQLLARLDESLNRKLTLVSAPAGYGKTTLLSIWAEQRSTWAEQMSQKQQVSVAWLSLDAGDNDLICFMRYFCAALEAALPSLGESLNALTARDQGIASGQVTGSLQNAQTDLLNLLQSITAPLILILDDYHLITEPAIHQFFAFFLDHLPVQMHLVIATRVDPPLPLSRLRARGEMIEIRLDQLRFTADEAAAFLEQFGGVRLNDDEVTTLTNWTEGWAAALQLAALAMQGKSDPAKYIQDFTGSSGTQFRRHILDYLIEEVLDSQPEAIRDFLLKTSILQRLSAPLCAAVTGPWEQEPPEKAPSPTITGAARILDFLERANLFLIPLDDIASEAGLHWYRYHHLFADLLRKRLQETQADRVPSLHMRAGQWLEKQGMFTEAIDHFFQAGEMDHAASLIERLAEDLLMRGEIATLMGWIQRLPNELVQSRPRLDLYWVTSLVLLAHDQETIETGLRRLSQWPELAHETEVLQAYRAVYAVRVSNTAKLAQQALDGLPENAVFFRKIAHWMVNAAQVLGSDLNQRIDFLEEMLQKARASGNRMAEASALCTLADARYRQANLMLARDLYQEAIHVGTDPDGRRLPIAGEGLVGLGNLQREWNELDQAVQSMENGIALSREVRETNVIEGFMGLAQCRQAQGDTAGARWAIEQAHWAARAVNVASVYDRLVDFYEALLLHQLGDHQAIQGYLEKWRTGRGASARQDPAAFDPAQVSDAHFEARLYKYEQVAWARACLANQKPTETLAVLEELLPQMVRQGQKLLVIEIEILQALAWMAQGKEKEAQAAIESALIAAETGGLIRLFIDEGPMLLPLLQKALQRKVSAVYVQRLIDLLIEAGAGQLVRATPLENSNLPEPLSARELEVLTFLTNRLSAKEIAEQLSVAESTVNSHINSIYGKLGVHRRLDAIRKAKTLGLI